MHLSRHIVLNRVQEGTSRREQLSAARRVIQRVPCRELFELSGRPSVAYEVRDYHEPEGRRLARFDLPFLFKAFETGQPAPPRAGTKNASKPRAATIHEYLDWTVTAEEPKQPSDLVSDQINTLPGQYCVLACTFFRHHGRSCQSLAEQCHALRMSSLTCASALPHPV